jgi:hypothetical protein
MIIITVMIIIIIIIIIMAAVMHPPNSVNRGLIFYHSQSHWNVSMKRSMHRTMVVVCRGTTIRPSTQRTLPTITSVIIRHIPVSEIGDTHKVKTQQTNKQTQYVQVNDRIG